MTIVVPYKNDILSDIELRFALRSIEKYFAYSNIVILGDPPDWYKGESVKVKDHEGRKQYSIYQKLLVACEMNNVTEDFIEWDDDVFINKSVELQYWSNGLLKEQVNKNHGSTYRKAVMNTLELFPEGVHFDLHNPIVYNKEKLKNIFGNETREIIIKSTYCNTLGIHGVYREDCKINELKSKEFIKEHIKDIFSTSTNGLKKPMREFLYELYPKKSKHER